MRLTMIAAALSLTACGGSRQAVGDVDSVIVIATDSLWAAVGDSMLAALEPRIFTVRPERTFEVTHVAPSDDRWMELRRFRQVLTLGAAGDPWVKPVLETAREGERGGDIVQSSDVWASNQFATAAVLPASSAADAARDLVPRIAAVLDSTFRVYAVRRMYMSGADTLLRDSLADSAGFGILLPMVYEPVDRGPGVWLFQNSTSIGGDLIRSVLVTSLAGLLEPTAEVAFAWRDSVARAEYLPPQETAREPERMQSRAVPGAAAIEVQGVWTGTDPSWPSSGPFIARVVQCPAQNRTYLIDTWLFAPGRSKYEYMIQLNTMLDTFACA
ncbi:MAG: DUF4837 family protein [Gemmatimonadota bacterium]